MVTSIYHLRSVFFVCHSRSFFTSIYLDELICVVKVEETIVSNSNSFNIAAKSKVEEQLRMAKIHLMVTGFKNL